MEPVLLSLAGAAVALYCLWQLRRWLQESQAAAAAAPQRLEALVDELLATAEATTTVVQEKAEALEAAIAEADRRIAALGGSPAAGAGSSAARPVAAVAPSTSAAAAVPAPATAEPTGAPAEPATSSAAESAAAADPAPEPPELHRAVYTLVDAGQDLTTVARRLGLTKGEVQLILGLRQSQGAGREARP